MMMRVRSAGAGKYVVSYVALLHLLLTLCVSAQDVAGDATSVKTSIH
jgi:hypothetical protein